MNWMVAVLVIWMMALITGGTIQIFFSDLSALATPAATAYAALLGIPTVGLYKIVKQLWQSYKDKDNGADNKDQESD